jgi:S-adenosylmethionine hydrolase
MSISSGSSSTVVPDPPIITLLTDFGLSDSYVASMKGVILSICRKAILVDISHNVTKFRISQAAYLLSATVHYFPPGSIHLCVVDPGVGTNRRAILVKTRRSFLVGPDNGVLMLAAKDEGIEKAIEIENPKYMLDKISSTFHGRDIFASVTAHLANGVSIDEFGPRAENCIQLTSKYLVSDGKAKGEIIHVDDFGNIVTNIPSSELAKIDIKTGSKTKITIGRKTLEMTLHKTYGEVKAGEPVALIGSTGFLEISINKGDAAKTYKAKEEIGVSISRIYR